MKSPAQRMIAQRRLALVTERTPLQPGNVSEEPAKREMTATEVCVRSVAVAKRKAVFILNNGPVRILCANGDGAPE